MIELAGNLCIRNGISLDYCFEETIKSLLPICDKIYVADGESTDGTKEFLQDWSNREPKLFVTSYIWTNPKGNLNFWVDWLNWCRTLIREPFQLQLDADEVISEESYPVLDHFKQTTDPGDRVSLRMPRYNFWRDPWSLIPHGHCLSHEVIRLAPSNVFMPSDGIHRDSKQIAKMVRESDVAVYHYGFLRRRDAYFKKSKELFKYFFNSYDQRLVEAEQKPGNWMEQIENVEWTKDLIRFNGSHPKVIIRWLQERNYKVTDDGKPYHE